MAGEDVGEQPDVSEISRMNVEITSIGKIRSSIGAVTPAGIRLFR